VLDPAIAESCTHSPLGAVTCEESDDELALTALALTHDLAGLICL